MGNQVLWHQLRPPCFLSLRTVDAWGLKPYLSSAVSLITPLSLHWLIHPAISSTRPFTTPSHYFFSNHGPACTTLVALFIFYQTWHNSTYSTMFFSPVRTLSTSISHKHLEIFVTSLFHEVQVTLVWSKCHISGCLNKTIDAGHLYRGMIKVPLVCYFSGPVCNTNMLDWPPHFCGFS